MSVNNKTPAFLLRIQSPVHGTKRISSNPNQLLRNFLKEVENEFKLNDSEWRLFLDRKKSFPVVDSEIETLNTLSLKHGDMLYLEIVASADKSVPQQNIKNASSDIKEDEIDLVLSKLDGKIYRKKNEQYCRHGPQGKCLHCVPLEPYDEEYLSTLNPPIKFLSFHSYVRKIHGGVDKGKFAMLENVCCKIKPGCKEHLPWPGGICSKCQPNAVTLQRQNYRHVDFIQLENPGIMDRYLDFWRRTGNQRIGFLYGRYEHHKDIPLGIKAVVSAIYEPMQVGSKNKIDLLSEETVSAADVIAAKLGLRRVGWIFTDLVPLDASTGSVRHFRGNVDSYFLSAEECITAADFQNQHPNACHFATEGHFGSKFVTVVATGDSTNKIHFDGYQVSNQAMALVRDDCLIPTLNAHELGYIKESTNEQYVPDVFYKTKDEYGNDVNKLARPLPVEYLLTDIAVAFPKEQAFTFFAADGIKLFPIENRNDHGNNQTFDAFCNYIKQFPKKEYMQAFRDFHLLIFLHTFDMLALKESMEELIDALKTNDELKFNNWLRSEAWGKVELLMDAHSSTTQAVKNRSAGNTNFTPVSPWNCQHCTFLNLTESQSCEMCTLPKN